MMNNETVLFTFIGPLGVRVDIGQSLIGLIGLLFFFGMRSDLIYTVMICVGVLLAIFLHELGHAWGNQVQSVPVRRIMLHGGGGFCESRRTSSRHQQELIVAMGPIVNAVLWALCGLASTAVNWFWMSNDHVPGAIAMQVMDFLWLFGQINFFLCLFNLIPVQPLDGGKLFHLSMLRLTNAQTARQITGGLGLVLAVLWIPAMIMVFVFQGWILFFIPSIPAHYRMMRGVAA